VGALFFSDPLELPLSISLALSMLLISPEAEAAQLEWAGHYRARGLIFDSLSLSDTHDQAEGTSNLFDHRIRLQPRWIISERVALHAQIDALDLVPWGSEPEAWEDPVTGDETYTAYDQTMVAPTTEDGGATPAGIALSRAWGEVYTGIGRLRFGRVPLHWGTGIWLNDGLSPEAEFGDTADRLQFTGRVGLLYLMGALDMNYEGYLNAPDDMKSLNLALAYRSETIGVGFYNQYRYQASESFGAYTGDIWLHAALGPVTLDSEVVGVFGGGNLGNGVNDIRIGALGAMLRGDVEMEKLLFGLEGGLATGDADPDDEVIKTFSFDRDHNLGLMLFEEAMPTLAATTANEDNQGRDFDAVLTGEGVRNALYVRPRVGYRFIPELKAELAAFGAQAAKLPEDQSDQKGYGWEIDLSMTYEPYEHFSVMGAVGVFLPGKYYTSFDDEELGTGFDRRCLGGMLVGTVAF